MGGLRTYQQPGTTFFLEFQAVSDAYVLSPNTVPVSVDQGLNAGNSNSGLRKTEFYPKCD